MSEIECIPSPPRPSLLQMSNLFEDTVTVTTPNISSRISVCDQSLLDHSLKFLWEKGDEQSSPSMQNPIDQGFFDIASRKREKEHCSLFDSSYEGIFSNCQERNFISHKYLSKRRKCFYIMLTMLTLTVIFSRISIYHKRSKPALDSNGEDNLSNTSNNDLGNSSSKCLEDRCIKIKQRIVREGISNDHVLNFSGSPQYLSLNWIARTDEMNLNVEDDRLLLRYALAVFFFATNEDIDTYQWDDTKTWLSKDGVCQWKGVTCELSHITHLNVSNYRHALSGSIVSELFRVMVR